MHVCMSYIIKKVGFLSDSFLKPVHSFPKLLFGPTRGKTIPGSTPLWKSGRVAGEGERVNLIILVGPLSWT